MAKTKALKGRIKEEYRRNLMILMGGVSFRKDAWTQIPRGKEDQAKKDYAEILDFEEGTVDLAEEAAKLEVGKGTPGTHVGADTQQAVWQEELPSSQVDAAVQTNLDRGADETTSGKSTSGKVRNPKKG